MLKDETAASTFGAPAIPTAPLDGRSFQTSRRVPDDVFRSGNRVVINDLDLGITHCGQSSTRRLGLRSIFCVPLKYLCVSRLGNMSGVGRMETIGVLYVDSQNIGAGLVQYTARRA